MKATISLTGDKEVAKALQELDKKVAKVLLKAAMKAALKPMLAAARAKAPSRSGLLRKKIKLRTMKKSRKAFGFEVGVGEKDFTGKAWYGAAVEYGTSKQAPQGFLRQAFDETKDIATGIAIRVIKAGINVV